MLRNHRIGVMKILVPALILLQLTNFSAAQCVDGWTSAGGQCMRCSSTFTGVTDTDFASAQTVCSNNGGNLATIINRDQENYLSGCSSSGTPWVGYTATPFPGFIDGTKFINYAGLTITPGAFTADCWILTSVGTWTQLTACTVTHPFACSRPYDSCYEVEVSGVTSVAYTPSDTSTVPAGKRWVGTTAMYSCSEGYSISGGSNPRTCQDNASWSGSAPECVAAPVCSTLTAPSDSSISYSTTASGSSYTTGTVATQACNSGYEMKSGSSTRTCQSSGAWTEAAIVCEKEDNNDDLAIGLGVGLGVPLALALAALLFWMCRSTPAVLRPTPAPRAPAPYPRPVGYPHPAFRPPYPRRMGPRPIF